MNGAEPNPDDQGPPAAAPESQDRAPTRTAVERTPIDPWAHRRGEPRVFTLLWTMYVLAAVAGSVLWLATTGRFTATGYGPAARIMLMIVMTGVVLVWPMVRLSQAFPAHATFAILADVAAVLLPIQLVIWPLVFLALWPLWAVVSVAVTFVIWTFVVGGLLALATADRLMSRTAWMATIVVMMFVCPVLGLAIRTMNATPPDWMASLSPFTSLRATTGTGVGSPQHRQSDGQRAASFFVGVLGGVLWIVAGTGNAGRGDRRLAQTDHPA